MKKTVGILLAGGMSRRYGSDKAFAKINDYYFYEKAYHALEGVCEEVIIVTRAELLNLFPSNYTVITDIERYVGCGPLAGIYSAMEYQAAERYVVLPCDMPLIDSEIMGQLLYRHQTEITIVEVAGRLQPLISVWDKSVKEKLAESLEEQQYRLRAVFDRASIMKVAGELLTEHKEVFMNVNTLKQDKEMRRWLKS